MASQPRPAASFSSRQHLSLMRSFELLLPTTLSVSRIPQRCWFVCASSQKLLIPISDIYKRNRRCEAKYYLVNRGLREPAWLTCLNISWRWLSQIISFYLLFLNLVAEAHDYTPPSTYSCEDVTNYYSHVKHLRDEALKKKLYSIVSPHHSLSYGEVWDALKILDAADVDKPDTSSGIIEIYSLRVVPKRLSGKPQGWNREHLWPRSYGLTNGPSLTDLHNIRPADVNVNASRGNKYYGECKAKSSKCLKPANKEASLDTETDKERWAPPMQPGSSTIYLSSLLLTLWHLILEHCISKPWIVRGDIARALMYMAVCYGFHQPGQIPGLRLSDTPKVEKKEMGLLSTLLKWNAVDPPSREEKLRNERICKFYQHNRNPFVDHPEYANLIWKQVVSRSAPNNNNNFSTTRKELGRGVNHEKI